MAAEVMELPLAGELACPSCRETVPAGAHFCPACAQPLAPAASRTVRMVEFIVPGDPIPQGSMKPVGKGRMAHSNAGLTTWRQKVNLLARSKVGPGWKPWDGPIALDLIFTLKRPKSAPKTKVIYPATKPDLDKLVRAVGDSLCPNDSGAFRLIAEDSRIVEYGQIAKTFPTPMNTHPGALRSPGARIRVRLLE